MFFQFHWYRRMRQEGVRREERRERGGILLRTFELDFRFSFFTKTSLIESSRASHPPFLNMRTTLVMALLLATPSLTLAFAPSSLLSPGARLRVVAPSTSFRSRTHKATTTTTTTTTMMIESGPTGTAPNLAKAYAAAGVASAASWAACAGYCLSRHPLLLLPARHNFLTILQALAFPLPITLAVTGSLAAAAASGPGWERLRSPTYRRLNLGLAVSSLWLFAVAADQALFVPSSLVPYPSPLRAAALATHGATALLCLGAWSRTVASSPGPAEGHFLPRVVRGLVGSLYGALSPQRPTGSLDDPDSPTGSDGRSELALASLLFAGFTALSVVAPFPTATVPSILGKRMAR